MNWTVARLRRSRPSARRRPFRKQFRPLLERLESRLAPANVDILSNHYDNLLTGANLQETVLTPANVNATTFGKQFQYSVEGYVFAQPLYRANLSIAGGTHNVVFVATEHDQVYAFDADNPTAGPNGNGLYWQRSFIDPANGITTVPQPEVISGDIVPEIGITGTPIIDAATNTLYVVDKTKEIRAGVTHYVQKIHALDLTTGTDRAVYTIGDTTPGGPEGGWTNTTAISVPGAGQGSAGGVLKFNALRQLQRPALQLVGNAVYVAWASHGDNGPYHGWVVGFDKTTLQPAPGQVFNTTPDAGGSGIWQSGGALAVDPQGNLYFAIGNGFAGPAPAFNAIGGAQSLGGGGGGLGYQGIGNSVAVTLRAFTTSQVGLGVNGNFQGQVPTGSIDFNAASRTSPPHTFRLDLSYNGTTLSGTLTDLSTTPQPTVFNLPPQALNIPGIVGGNSAWVGFTAATGGLNAQHDILTWTYNNGATTTINHSAGFASSGDLQANGSASFPGTVARLTPAQNGQTGSVFARNQVNVQNFSTSFTFQMVAGSNPIADGLTFTIQNNPPGRNYSEAVLKLSTAGQLSVADYFVPFDWQALDAADADLGSGGTMLLPDAVGSTAHPHLMVETGKSGKIYLIDRDMMGGFTAGADWVVQVFQLGPAGVWGNPAFLQTGPNTGLIYYQGSGDPQGMKGIRITNGVITGIETMSNQNFPFPGSQPSISANAADPANPADAIAWALQVNAFGSGGPAVLHAYNARNLSQELYNSNQAGTRDQMTGAVKFTFPVVTNGKVFAGANGSLAVFGLFPVAVRAPDAPTDLSGTALEGGTQVQLTWTNPPLDTDHDPISIRILRSTDGVTFTEVGQVNRFTSTFTDTGLTPSTLYRYRVVATNQVGDSPPSNTLAIRTRVAAPVVRIQDICAGSISLSWTATANDHYTVERGDADGANFTLIASLPAGQTSFTDTGLANGTYTYRVTGFSTFPDGNDSATSNVAKATIGPINISHVDPQNPTGPGFLDHSDMQANGSAEFTNENLLRLNNNFGQAGSAFTLQQVGARGFTTTFTVRLHEGTQPNPADGFTFTLQANGPGALGFAGGALGYQGIGRSVAIKFDVFNNEGESDNSTGLFFNGDFPGQPHAPGEVSIPLGPTGINLRSQSPKQITLTYNGTTLTETIRDLFSGAVFTTSYTVNIAAVLGSDTAYVGFTGGTGGLYSLQDILNWSYAEQEENLVPRAPTGLRVTDVERHDHNRSDVTISWLCNNAYTAESFIIERSTNGTNFTVLATVPTSQTTFTDDRLQGGTYYYRVRSANAVGTSRPSNVDSVLFGGGDAPTVVDHANGFTAHNDLTANGSATFFPNNDPVGTFAGHQDVGGVAARGGATFGANTYRLNASGADIWDTNDSFHFVYKPLTGDGEIVARVLSIGDTDFWAKGGVMMRESLAANSRNVFMMETSPRDNHNEVGLQWRTDTGGFTSDSRSGFGTQPPPVWVRLVRSGNNFSGFFSRDGVNWTQQGPTVTIPMGNTIFVGLALTAHNNGGVLNTSFFENVSIQGNTSAPLPTPVARLTAGDQFGAAGSVFLNNRVDVTRFSTAFAFQITPGTAPMADGLTFVIQGNAPTALGPAGNGLGYGPDLPNLAGDPRGIRNSVAIKFDIFGFGGEGTNSTGLFTDGRSPSLRRDGLPASVPDRSVDLTGTGIDLSSGHVFQVTLTYNGTTLRETIRDTVTGAQFVVSYQVDIAALAGNVAYVGFTGGTGGLTANLDVRTWTYTSGGRRGPGAAGEFVADGAPTPADEDLGAAPAVTPGGADEPALDPPGVNKPYALELYRALRGRGADDGGLAFWSNLPDPKAGREYGDGVAEDLYGALLKGSADAGGLDSFADWLGRGGKANKPHDALADFVNADEYFAALAGR